MSCTWNDFVAIKEFILTRGDRQTYCNMYNSNPHYAFSGFDAFLNPDVGQRNINCDPALSDFDHLVIRDWNAEEIYFDVRARADQTLSIAPAQRSAVERYVGHMLAVARGESAE